MPVFRLLAKLKFLRGTPFDPFGYTEERRTERELIDEYEALLDEILDSSAPTTTASPSRSPPSRTRSAASATSRMRHLKAAKAEEAALLEQFRVRRRRRC